MISLEINNIIKIHCVCRLRLMLAASTFCIYLLYKPTVFIMPVFISYLIYWEISHAEIRSEIIKSPRPETFGRIMLFVQLLTQFRNFAQAAQLCEYFVHCRLSWIAECAVYLDKGPIEDCIIDKKKYIKEKKSVRVKKKKWNSSSSNK